MLGRIESTLFECEVAEQVDRLAGMAGSESFVHQPPQLLRITVCETLIEPFFSLPIYSVTILPECIGRRRRNAHVAKPAGLDEMAGVNGHQIVARVLQDVLEFYNGLGPLLFGGQLFGGDDPTRHARRLTRQSNPCKHFRVRHGWLGPER
jgi:hypothetical protein